MGLHVGYSLLTPWVIRPEPPAADCSDLHHLPGGAELSAAKLLAAIVRDGSL